MVLTFNCASHATLNALSCLAANKKKRTTLEENVKNVVLYIKGLL